MPDQQIDLLGIRCEDLMQAARKWFGEEKGHGFARDIHKTAVRDGLFRPEDLGAGRRTSNIWRANTRLHLPEVAALDHEPSEHGDVIKRLLKFADNQTIECVSLPMGRGKRALCVSTQVGCARDCKFCETGRLGLLRNLTTSEIIQQVTIVTRTQPVDSIVFQGMGEPLDNLTALIPALQILADPAGFGFGHERLTVCTVGHVPGIDALRELGWKRLGLSLSLNSADETQRTKLMPKSARYSLKEIQDALIAYRQRKNLALGIHWCLMPNINDSAQDVDQIAKFLEPLGRTFFHVIPYNPGSDPITRPPTEREIVNFVQMLRARGIKVRRRITKGRSVMAGCGQLGAANRQTSDSL